MLAMGEEQLAEQYPFRRLDSPVDLFHLSSTI
jgi:hypothetical protein